MKVLLLVAVALFAYANAERHIIGAYNGEVNPITGPYFHMYSKYDIDWGW